MEKQKASRARLRPFRTDDAAGVCGIYPMFFVDNAIHLGGGRITVADVAGRVVGFVLWAPAFEPAWFDRGVKRWAELHELHVHPDFQNRGIGVRLVRAAVWQARAAGFPAMYLMGEDRNGPARRVDEKTSFRGHKPNRPYKREVRARADARGGP